MSAHSRRYTRDDFRAPVHELFTVGYKARKFVQAAWLRTTDAVKRVTAHLYKRYSADNLGPNFAKEKADEEALRELLRLAAANIGAHAKAALAAIGASPRTLWNAPRRERAKAGAAALDKQNGDYFWRYTRPQLIEEIADSLRELVTQPAMLEAALQAA